MRYGDDVEVQLGDVVRALVPRVAGPGNMAALVGVVAGTAPHGRLIVVVTVPLVMPPGVTPDARWWLPAANVCITVDRATGRVILTRQQQEFALAENCELLQRADGTRPAQVRLPPALADADAQEALAGVEVHESDGEPD